MYVLLVVFACALFGEKDPAGPVDRDHDGFAGAEDCDDTDAEIHPQAPEVPYDGIDQDCWHGDLLDADHDTYDWVGAGGDDCDDNDQLVNPGRDEVPMDGIDNDCTGGDFADLDGDGYTSDAAGGDDCDDNNPYVHPGVD